MGRPKGSPNKKSIWLMESLAKHGYDYEKVFTKHLQKAATGDRLALDMCHLLVKLIPYLANMPKQDVGISQIETLVINRFDSVKPAEAIETTATDAEVSAGVDSSVHTDGRPPENVA